MHGDFCSRIKRTDSKSDGSSAKIVNVENDFPFEHVDFIRIGSAHAVCSPDHDAENADLLLRLASCVMARFQPDQLPATVRFQPK